MNLLRNASADGLDPARYSIDQIESALSNPSDRTALRRADRLLSEATIAYAHDLRVPPSATSSVTYVDAELAPAPLDAEALLGSDQPAQRLQQLQSGNPLYQELRRGLAWYRLRWSSLPQNKIFAGEPLGIGSSGEPVAALRRRLGLPVTNAPFDASLGDAVQAFREVHGLGTSPVADVATIDALNLGGDYYERLISINLDRLRGLPIDGRRYIVVDTAGAWLRMIEAGNEVGRMRVIVGRPAMPTPELAGLIRFAVFNPYWNVPPDLVRNSIAPQVLRAGPEYLTEHRYALFSDWRARTPDVDLRSVDWNDVSSGARQVWVRQLPGGDNMMGEVKFMLPNRLGIYLHDTPRRAYFSRNDRRLSSGCVRVEDAHRLARWIFGRYPLERGEQTPELRIDVPHPVPVFITYLTAVPEAGRVRFQRDGYGRDGALLAGDKY